MIAAVVASIEGREVDVRRLIRSIEDWKVDCHIIVVRQYKLQTVNFDIKYGETINIREYGASKARNEGIKRITEAEIAPRWVCFPDDDGYYARDPSQALLDAENYELAFGDVMDYGENFRLGARIFLQTATLAYYFPFINCPSFFLKWELAKNTYFDERYGPGSEVPAVEETEYFTRLIQHHKVSCIYDRRIRLLHPVEGFNSRKITAYAESQGHLLRRLWVNRQIVLAVRYALFFCRPLVGFFLNLPIKNKRLFYQQRVTGIVEGWKRSKNV